MEVQPGSIAEAVRRLRTSAGLSQGAVAARAQVSERSVRNIESGAVRPQRDVMRRVADVVGLDLSVLPVGDGLRIGVLGPFVVEAGGEPADVGPAKQRSLLALLALRPGIPVGNDEIVDFLWGDRPPASCVNLVHTYASRLRRALQAHRSGVQVSSVRGGYRLTADADALDLLRFEERVEAAQRSKAVKAYEQALDCWRGPILNGMPASLRQHPAALAAERRRLNTALEYADVALSDGRCDAERLHPLAGEEPLHEGLRARLMLALAASGQQAAALRAFDDIRRRLDDELGVQPGIELRDAQLRVLRNDLPTAPRATASYVRPAELPADVVGYIGRDDELRRLVSRSTSRPIFPRRIESPLRVGCWTSTCAPSTPRPACCIPLSCACRCPRRRTSRHDCRLPAPTRRSSGSTPNDPTSSRVPPGPQTWASPPSPGASSTLCADTYLPADSMRRHSLPARLLSALPGNRAIG